MEASLFVAKAQSDEERDLLEHSLKKTKVSGKMKQPQWVEIVTETEENDEVADRNKSPSMGRETRTIPNVRDTPLGEKETKSWEEEGHTSEDEEENSKEEEPDGPTIPLTKREKAIMHSPWKYTLIIKVMGLSMGYTYLLRRIATLWKPKSHVEMVALKTTISWSSSI